MNGGTINGISNVPVKALGRGSVKIKTRVKDKQIIVQLRDVLHVPTAVNNLISISRLNEQGGRARFDNGQVTLLNQN
ncbi:uncharacterized protein EDB93DRAFT_1092040 [Suillus bovinus]|uniref:uncharacterized protein n=1 Tax=Suillus bovinus TaxID=48563 RepID=UPI001B867237|nr:uncharacterized protein EDB93DRAFT_1092040 [Suillus bovinus]KAG2135863.1 hypothetical protein EDB93DRAFT_1092040 [Suillus bovinus]